MNGEPASAVRLRALSGEPLKDEHIRDMVVATAQSLAERQGVSVLNVQADSTSIRIELAVPRIVAIGFAAELRRVTTRWFTRKYGVDTLWGEPEAGEDGPGSGGAWKSA